MIALALVAGVLVLVFTTHLAWDARQRARDLQFLVTKLAGRVSELEDMVK